MKALLSTAPGGPNTLQLSELPDPVAGPGELLVRVRAAAINYPDVLIIEDKYQMRPPRPFAPGGEIGRHHILTHCYWREGGPEFRNVNIMAVAHGTDKTRLLEHKAAIDAHLAAKNVPLSYTNVFWGGRSEIKPSEISPMLYRKWLSEITPQAA